MKLPDNALIQFPSGRWGFIGRVEARLAYINADGTPPTEQQVSDARHFGVHFTSPRLKTRSWDTKEAALAELEVA